MRSRNTNSAVRGIAYIAIGQQAKAEAARSMENLVGWPIAVIEEAEYADSVQASRWAKVNLDQLVPQEWREVLYLDADTRPRGDVSIGFEILSDGWDVVLVPSSNQGADLLWHLGAEEWEETMDELCSPLQLQAGVFWFARNERTERLFAQWRSEWQRWKGQDQGALLRALARAPVKLWLLGFPWNGGAAIQHLFGRTR